MCEEALEAKLADNQTSLQETVYRNIRSKEESIQNISDRCLNLIQSLSKRSRQGFQYALTISKLLGLKHSINPKAQIALYLPERENLFSFYEKEKDKKTETDKRHL